MNDVAQFMSSLRAAAVAEPDPRIGAGLVPRLAEIARASTIEAETQATQRRPRSRLSMLARVGIAVAAIPLLFAGLAVAGATLPHVARSAFDRVGIELPNQPSSSSGSDGAEHTATPATEASQGTRTNSSGANPSNSEPAHRHALEQHQKAKGKALGHERGKAIGLNGLTPPGQSNETAPPSHSHAGGSAQSQ